MSSHEVNPRRPLFIGWCSLVLAVIVYCAGLGSDHLATNGDELLYAQIARITASDGALLPLRSIDGKADNTKPPLLFWQGIVSTGWGAHWSLARLRAPNVLYTLLTAGLLLVAGWRRGRDPRPGIQAALLYLCFFSTYRYGRVFLTSAPETFWIFAPFALMLLRREPRLPDGLSWLWLWGGLTGIGLLYKSFALVIPVTLALTIWQWRARGWSVRILITRDLWRIGLMAAASLLLFALWFWLDPEPRKVFQDFVLRENVGKFHTYGGNYLLNLLFGGSSLWRIVAAYPLNAGLLAPAVVALCWDAWKRRRRLATVEVLLWIWVLVLAAFFCIPNQRDERYLLPAMPALALLLALRLGHLPHWVKGLVAGLAGLVLIALLGLSLLLCHRAGLPILYPLCMTAPLVAGLALVILGFLRKDLQTLLLAPEILLVYLGYFFFLLPLDHGPGLFRGEGVESVIGCEVAVPVNFNAREESYGFLLPGAMMKPYDHRGNPPRDASLAVISLPLDQPPPGGVILARRLNMIDRFDAAETRDILMGNVTRHLFHWDWLVQQPSPP